MNRRYTLPILACALLGSCQRDQATSELDETKASLYAAEQELVCLRNANISKDQDIISLQNQIIGLQKILHGEAPPAINLNDGLSEHLDGRRGLVERFLLFDHPLSYYSSIKVKDPNAKLKYPANYHLSAELIDMDNLSYLYSRQGYYITPEEMPILQLAMNNFPGLREIPHEKW